MGQSPRTYAATAFDSLARRIQALERSMLIAEKKIRELEKPTESNYSLTPRLVVAKNIPIYIQHAVIDNVRLDANDIVLLQRQDKEFENGYYIYGSDCRLHPLGV